MFSSSDSCSGARAWPQKCNFLKGFLPGKGHAKFQLMWWSLQGEWNWLSTVCMERILTYFPQIFSVISLQPENQPSYPSSSLHRLTGAVFAPVQHIPEHHGCSTADGEAETATWPHIGWASGANVTFFASGCHCFQLIKLYSLLASPWLLPSGKCVPACTHIVTYTYTCLPPSSIKVRVPVQREMVLVALFFNQYSNSVLPPSQSKSYLTFVCSR